MRRLFFGRRNRDDRKGGNNDEQRGDGSKTSNPDGIDGAGNEFTAPQQPVLSTAAVPSSNDGNTAPTPVVKQVAFITPVHSPAQPSTPADDIQSLVGTSGLVCFPRHPSSSSNPAQAGQSTIDRANSPKASLHVPSQPTRHVSLDTANRMNNGGLSPDMSKSRQSPLSNTSLPSASNTNVASDPMVRSGTSLSQNTVASTASSAIGGSYLGHSPLYGGPHSASFQPNVTILASYARDQNTDTASNGIRQHLTWSEITNDELVDNLGGRERTRQEVLFEIVCSEERYVQDLLSLYANYIEPLLRSCGSSMSQLGIHYGGTQTSLPPVSLSYTSTRSSPAVPSRNVSPPPRPAEDLNGTMRAPSSKYASHIGGANSNSQMESSMDNLPIASMFAHRTSIEMTYNSKHTYDTAVGSTNTARSTVSPPPSSEEHSGYTKSRDASGSTAITSNPDIDRAAGPETIRGTQISHGPGNEQPRSGRLAAIFGNGNLGSMQSFDRRTPSTSTGQVDRTLNVPTAFRHHLKALIPPPPNKLHKTGLANLTASAERDLPLIVPDALRIVCETVARHLLEGHLALSGRLRARYEEQYPLVRTLADVFTDQAWMIQHYATYVVNLEQALEDIEEILAIVNPVAAIRNRAKSKEVLKEQKRLAREIMRLEEQAAMRGQPGLFICLSQPFQRLLKYPLLFQSLLYHTDSSTKDYDATQQLAFEIDAIVRSIEDQKASEEDRARTRDCWARIEDVDDRTLMIPRPDRLLVSETAMWTPSPSLSAARRTFSDAGRELRSIEAVQAESNSKAKNFRRLSDLVGGEKHNHFQREKVKKEPSVGSKRDVWLVKFTDVVIRCQRVGITKLPIGNSSKPRNIGRHEGISSTKDRNLYRFLKIDHWVMRDSTHSSPSATPEIGTLTASRVLQGAEEALSDTPEDEEASRPPTPMHAEEGRKNPTHVSEIRPAFDIDPLIGLKSLDAVPAVNTSSIGLGLPGRPTVSSTTRQVIRREAPANAKFSNRVRPSIGETMTASATLSGKADGATGPRVASRASERAKGAYNRPTAASMAKSNIPKANTAPMKHNKADASPASPRVRASSAISKGAAAPISPDSEPQKVLRRRRSSFSVMPSGSEITADHRTKHSSQGNRDSDSGMDSGVALFSQYWKEDRSAV